MQPWFSCFLKIRPEHGKTREEAMSVLHCLSSQGATQFQSRCLNLCLNLPQVRLFGEVEGSPLAFFHLCSPKCLRFTLVLFLSNVCVLQRENISKGRTSCRQRRKASLFQTTLQQSLRITEGRLSGEVSKQNAEEKLF